MHQTCFEIPGFLSSAECRALVEQTERRGYQPAPVTTSRGFVMMPELRNNTRVIVDDVALAERLWARLTARAPIAPAAGSGWHPVGLNERFRFYRYDRAEAFRWHRDGAFVRHDDERSFLTFMVYLNDGFAGGATELDLTGDGDGPHVVPRAGAALVFAHALRHQGAEVVAGRKYVLRSDVMFRRGP